MSGVEAAEPSFVWQLSLGTVLTLLTTVSLVGGGFMAFMRHLKANRETSEKALAEIVNMKKQIDGHEESTAESIKHNLERINELKTMMAMIDRRIDDVRHDYNKRDDERKKEIEDLAELLRQFKDEFNRLVLDVERRMKSAATEDRRIYASHRDEDRRTRQDERKADRDSRYSDEDARSDYEGDAGPARGSPPPFD